MLTTPTPTTYTDGLNVDPSDPAAVKDAFDAGRVYLVVDKPQPQHRGLGSYIGDGTIADGTKIQFVHVISRPAHGEIRGYVLTPDGQLRLRLPCYSGEWAAMDEAVLARVEGANAIAPYVADATGAVRS